MLATDQYTFPLVSGLLRLRICVAASRWSSAPRNPGDKIDVVTATRPPGVWESHSDLGKNTDNLRELATNSQHSQLFLFSN